MRKESLLPNKLYDIFKVIAWVIPWIIVLYEGLGVIWNFPFTSEICKSLEIIECALCGMLGISTAQYNKVIPQTIIDSNEEEYYETENDCTECD